MYLQVTSLKQLLIQLQAGDFVVVNGMNGCGKSSLVAEVLNDPLILMQYFQVCSLKITNYNFILYNIIYILFIVFMVLCKIKYLLNTY